MTDKTGLAGIWEDLSSYLTVDVRAAEPGKDGRCVVEFVVTNNAVASLDSPDVVFEEVRLKYGVPPDVKTKTAKDLGCGQSFKHQSICRVSDLVKLKYSVEGRVSANTLLGFRGRSNGIQRGPSAFLSWSVYTGFLNEVNVHRWLHNTLESLPEPGPETTLAEIERNRKTLSLALEEIRETREGLEQIIGFIGPEQREVVLDYKKLADEYLKHTEEGLGRLSEALATLKASEFKSLKGSIMKDLRAEGARLDQDTSQLRKRFAQPS
jgi:hypothetical protein